MAVFAYRCTCGVTRDVAHDRDARVPVMCTCGEWMRRDWRTIQVSPSALVNRRNTNPTNHTADPVWERGIVTVPRGDMRAPLIHSGGRPVRVKEYAQRRHEFEAKQREFHNSPNVR